MVSPMISLLDLLYAAGNRAALLTQAAAPSTFARTIQYIQRRSDMLGDLVLEHLWLVVVSVGIAVVVSLILGVVISYRTSLASTVLAICQILMTIPSMAMLGFMVPLFGIGFTTGVIALILYALLPVVRNTYTGIREISPAVVESAVGMGMSEWRVLTKIKIPLARPVIMAGIRTATVMVVGIAAIAAYVGAGGLGELIFQGISRSNEPMIIVGAIGVSIIALVFDFVLSWGERRLAAIGKGGS